MNNELTPQDYANLPARDLNQVVALTLHDYHNCRFTVRELETATLYTIFAREKDIELGRITVGHETDVIRYTFSQKATLLEKVTDQARKEKRKLTDEEKRLTTQFRDILNHLNQAVDARIQANKRVLEKQNKTGSKKCKRWAWIYYRVIIPTRENFEPDELGEREKPSEDDYFLAIQQAGIANCKSRTFYKIKNAGDKGNLKDFKEYVREIRSYDDIR